MFKTNMLIFLIGLIGTGCASVSQPVYKVPEKSDCSDDGTKNSQCKRYDGIPYVLPRTALKVNIPVITQVKTEGDFVKEARKIFEIKKGCEWDEKSEKKCDEKGFHDELGSNATCIPLLKIKAAEQGIDINSHGSYGGADVIKNKIGEVSLSTEALPDPSQLYYVEVKGGKFEKRGLDIAFSPNGVPSEINTSAENKTVEFVAKTVGSALGLLTKLGSPNNAITTSAVGNACEMDKSDYRFLITRSLETLDYIKTFPATRQNLLSGSNTAVAKDNLEFRLKELDATFDGAMAWFEGEKKTTTKNYDATLLPAQNDIEIPIALFNKTCGLYRVEDPDEILALTTIPKPKEDCTSGTNANIKAILSTPPHLRNASLPTRIANSLDTASAQRGIYYRVPATSRISILADTEDLLVKDVAIAQLGEIASLPAETGSSSVTYKVTLDPVTGMLLKVSIMSDAANTSAAKDFIDPVADYLKARETSRDELTQLQREEAILKAKKSIKDLKDSLGQ